MNKNLITITSLASKKLKQIIINEKAKGLLFYVESGGCNGFGYKFKTVNFFENKNNLYKKNGLTVEICNKSLFYVLGTKIDWKKDIMGSNFSFDNPVAQASCGCGTSFTPQ